MKASVNLTFTTIFLKTETNFHEKVASINLYERTADVTVSFEGTMKVN